MLLSATATRDRGGGRGGGGGGGGGAGALSRRSRLRRETWESNEKQPARNQTEPTETACTQQHKLRA